MDFLAILVKGIIAGVGGVLAFEILNRYFPSHNRPPRKKEKETRARVAA